MIPGNNKPVEAWDGLEFNTIWSIYYRLYTAFCHPFLLDFVIVGIFLNLHDSLATDDDDRCGTRVSN
jgi:hypothetical protein